MIDTWKGQAHRLRKSGHTPEEIAAILGQPLDVILTELGEGNADKEAR